MAFTANDVKNLREMTGVGMLDCKKALAATDGDIDKAVEYLREKGLAAAQKKAGRIAAEGMAYAAVVNGVGVVVEVNAETDFVGQNELFIEFTKGVAQVIAQENPADLEALLTMAFPGTGRTVQEEQQEKIMVIGENIQIRRFVRYADGVNVSYNHMGGRIGVLVNMEVSAGLEGNAAVIELGKDIAMQIAAMNPGFRDKSDVNQDTLDKEREILMAQAKAENDAAAKPKPENILVKMVEGRVSKFYEENCLLQQAYVKENKISVEQHVAAVAKELGGSIAVKGFVRFEKGEGIEKKEDNFAAEVASMMQ
jgi:elongation factor Ts